MKTKKFASVEEVMIAINTCRNSFKDLVNNSLIDTDFSVGDFSFGYYDRCSVELVIYTDTEKKEIARWNTLTLYIEEDVFDTGKGLQFKSNISTTGEFDLEDTSRGSRANYYAQVGKVLGNQELLGKIKQCMLQHATAFRNLRDELEKMRKQEA